MCLLRHGFDALCAFDHLRKSHNALQFTVSSSLSQVESHRIFGTSFLLEHLGGSDLIVHIGIKEMKEEGSLNSGIVVLFLGVAVSS